MIDGDVEDLVIEPYAPSDLSSIMEIENVSFTIPWSRQSYEEVTALDSVETWVARQGGELVGYALVQKVQNEMELHTFAVKPECRRMHVGERILEFLIGSARDRRINNIFLLVRTGNSPARKLYEKLGFVSVGVRRNYYDDTREDAIVMRLALQIM